MPEEYAYYIVLCRKGLLRMLILVLLLVVLNMHLDSRTWKSVIAFTQIRRCGLKLCHVDKTSTRTCIFDDIEIL